jgi:O-succinylhomoserine sulfhydrylase
VSYPFLDSHPQHDLATRQMANGGPVVTFEVDGTAADTIAVIDRCRVARIALSLGGPETLLTHPATIAKRFTPDERAELGVSDALVRMSVGLEHPDDLLADLTQALNP